MRRTDGTECPLTGEALEVLNLCRACRFYRGFSETENIREVLCNWPRDGSYRDPSPAATPEFDALAWNRLLGHG